MLTIAQLRDEGAMRLQGAGFDRQSAQFDVLRLLAYVLEKPSSWLYSHLDEVVDDHPVIAFEQLLYERSKGVPIAYLLGEVGFWRLQLKVSPATLIPRPETELIVSTALQLMPQHHVVSALDLGTGTGAIALALAQERPDWIIRGYDHVPEAVALAQHNAALNHLQQVSFACHDWNQSLPYWPCDLVVSNPPYINALDPHLSQGDVRFEPRSALVSEASGLADLQTVIKRATQLLKPSGLLLIEHGYDQGQPVEALLHAAGFQNLIAEFDLQGHWRVSGGYWHL